MSAKMMNGLVLLIILPIVGRHLYYNFAILFAVHHAKKNPTEENAIKLYKLLKPKFGVVIRNYSENWAEYKELFHKINSSSDIPTELKEKIKQCLVKKDVFISNVKIIDNYKKM